MKELVLKVPKRWMERTVFKVQERQDERVGVKGSKDGLQCAVFLFGGCGPKL